MTGRISDIAIFVKKKTMTEKQIPFSGVSLTPYADVSPDGQLSFSEGVELHNGGLRPSALHGSSYNLPSNSKGMKLVYVHTALSATNFIFQSSDSLYYSTLENERSLAPAVKITGFQGEIGKIHAIGNTLAVMSDQGIQYALLKDGAYKYLGFKPQELVVNFAIETYIMKEPCLSDIDGSVFQKEKDPNGDAIDIFVKDDKRSFVASLEHESINRLKNNAESENMVCYPVFVRYALRMYDGSHIMHSAPILLLPNTNVSPAVVIEGKTNINDFVDSGKYKAYAVGYASRIKLKIINGKTALTGWEDIIQSVDIFLSIPTQTRMMDTEITTLEPLSGSDAGDSRTYGYNVYLSLSEQSRVMKFSAAYNAYSPAGEGNSHWVLSSESVYNTNLWNTVRDNGLFYLAKSYSLEEVSQISGNFNYLFKEEDKGVLTNLSQSERLSDDYQTHDTLIPSYAFTYNQRLNIANIDRILFNGYDSAILYQDLTFNGATYKNRYIYTFIKKQGKTYIVKNSCSEQLSEIYPIYFYYPDPDAYKILIPISDTQGFAFNLIQHKSLNGAYLLMLTIGEEAEPKIENIPTTTTDNHVTLENKIYTSEVGNPFYFPLAGINTVGVGRIIGMSSIVTALSQGQFGQFPLMVFCTDGNYAMQVNDEGLYSSVSPMQRDVCINPGSITQTDAAVVYVSTAGIMRADGSSIDCLSDAMRGRPEQLPDGLEGWNIPQGIPQELFSSCTIAYDYAGRRMIFFSSSSPAAYILSMENGTWSSASFGKLLSAINSYPYSYVQLEGAASIMRLDDSSLFTDYPSYKGLVWTRPVKLDTLQLKRLHQISVEGIFSTVQQISIYGSQDGLRWLPIGTSSSRRIGTMPGRYFKYFRFLLQTSLSEGENISGLRLVYEVRSERRIR